MNRFYRTEINRHEAEMKESYEKGLIVEVLRQGKAGEKISRYLWKGGDQIVERGLGRLESCALMAECRVG
jgi:hypothetical protein